MEREEQIVAIEAGRAPYAIGKLEAHQRGVRHLAVSVFVFHGDSLLMQRRATGKYHAAGLWANTCCSHPRWGEPVADCAVRRLGEEVGLHLPLAARGTIEYSTAVGALHEHELVHCYSAVADAGVPLDAFDRTEVAALKWCPLPDLAIDVDRRPERYAPWFAIYMREHRRRIESWIGG